MAMELDGRVMESDEICNSTEYGTERFPQIGVVMGNWTRAWRHRKHETYERALVEENIIMSSSTAGVGGGWFVDTACNSTP